MGIYEVSSRPEDMQKISEMSEQELLDFLGIKSSMQEVFRNYAKMNEEERIDYLREWAEEKNSKYPWPIKRITLKENHEHFCKKTR